MRLETSNIQTIDSNRELDVNGYMLVTNNPIAKAGVFDYLGSEIGAEEPNKIYKVYRPFEELKKASSQFEGKPIILTHQWVDTEDNPTIVGAITGEVVEEEPYLKSTLTIYEKDIIQKIENKEFAELSPGYYADYEEVHGDYKGIHYDFIQKNIKFNHLALVEEGRSGKDVRVLDNMPTIKNTEELMSKMTKDEVAEEKATDTSIVDELLAVANSELSDEEKKAKLQELLDNGSVEDEEVAEEETSDEETTEEPKEEETSDEDVEEKETSDNVNEIKDLLGKLMPLLQDFFKEEAEEPQHSTDECSTEDEEVEEPKDEQKKAEDTAKRVREEIAKSYKAYDDVKVYTGSFDFMNMSEAEIYQQGYKAVAHQDCKVEDSKALFKGFMNGRQAKKIAMDSAFSNVSEIDSMIEHLR